MKLSDLTWKSNVHLPGEQAIITFPNGYGASILRGGAPYTYTADGTYELAVLHNGDLCYTTPITFDVLAHRSATEIEEALVQIEQLPTTSK